MLIDARGLTCPMPLLKAKEFIDANPGTAFIIMTDNGAAQENVGRFLQSKRVNFTLNEKDQYTEFRVNGRPLAQIEGQEDKGIKIAVIISSDHIGRGDDELGRVLMHSFLKTLPELTPLPSDMIFMNGGVKLTCRDSEFLPALKILAEKGISIHVCGTCIDFFNLTEKVAVGRVSNMFEISTIALNSERVIRY